MHHTLKRAYKSNIDFGFLPDILVPHTSFDVEIKVQFLNVIKNKLFCFSHFEKRNYTDGVPFCTETIELEIAKE